MQALSAGLLVMDVTRSMQWSLVMISTFLALVKEVWVLLVAHLVIRKIMELMAGFVL